uniref:G_PROTEIN_RECEP_F1_2 domain-containing protein n=2 Tax=Bursaphelenchus xylophilus TaxID=6326 RepID=A0A1I7SH51_BURXY
MASLILKPDDTLAYFTFCNITNPSTVVQMQVGLAVMLTIDCLAVITDITVYTINYRIKRHRKRISPKIYTLTWSYQLTENNCSTTIVIPVTVSQSICYLLYITSSLVFFQLSLLTATIAFHHKYLMNYNNQTERRNAMKEKQSSQEYFTFLERHLDEAYKKRSVVTAKNNSAMKNVAHSAGGSAPDLRLDKHNGVNVIMMKLTSCEE